MLIYDEARIRERLESLPLFHRSALALDKNTRRVSTSEGGSIPDAVDDGAFYEIKDTKSASNTRQMRIQREAAAAEGKEHVLITGTNTRVSGPLGEASTVIRRDDLGPQ